MLTGQYGKKFNNYMGVALAYPTDSFETVFVDVARLSDHRVGGWPRPPSNSGVGGYGEAVKKLFSVLFQPLMRLPAPEYQTKGGHDHWEISEHRFNILLTACLRSKHFEDDADMEVGTFVISTYHMPCAFYAPMVMNIHAEMAARRCQDLAQDDPYVLAGDFNFLPDSPHYKLLTTGRLDRSDPTYPTSKYGMEWSSNIVGMKSAYGMSNRGEPEFTNYTQVEDDYPFVGTLDYIFLSDEWTISGVKNLPSKWDVVGPFPTEREPSDHVLIAANLAISYDINKSRTSSDSVTDGETAVSELTQDYPPVTKITTSS
uniref:Endonuclease/exonuclease/phosphatase domain-containing protein n=1 Tax=Pseudictyota dubia TaxID=2749911 RepID=A0A7R9W647_9STRA